MTGVHIDLSRLEAETAFVRAVTLPLKRVREAGEMTRIVLLVDALDESLASKTAKVLPRLLGEVEYAHLLVTARPDHRAIGGLRERAERMDLLADAPPGSDDVLEYLQRRLASEGAPAAMAVLSQRIAERASGNFLYAFYVVEALRRVNVLAGLDAAAARGVPLPEGGLPGVYSDFLRRELWRDDRAWSTRFGPVLAPLAVAQDEGLTTEQLRLMAGRLSDEPLTRTMVRNVTRTARQFLDGPVPDGPFRMYHQSFANFLVDPEQNPDFLIDAAETHGAIVEAYAATDPLSWDDYARRNLALHATEVGRLDHLLEDPRFLMVAEPSRLVPHLDAARSAFARATAAVYRTSARYLADLDRPARASQLELTAHRLGLRSLAARIATAAPDRPWQTRWSHGQPTGHQILTGHDDGVSAVATGALPDGTPVIVSGSDDYTVRVWRLADGTPVGEPLPHSSLVTSVAVEALPDGTPVIISGTYNGTVRVWRLADGTPAGEPLRGHDSRVEAVAMGALPDGTPVIVSADRDGTVRVWRLADGTPVGEPLPHPYGPVALPDGGSVIVSGTYNGTVRLWRLPGGTPVIVSADRDGTVRVWRLADGTPVGEPLPHPYDPVALADGTPVIVSGSDDGPVLRVPDGTPVINDGTVQRLPDATPVIVVGPRSPEDTMGVWRLADGTPVGEPLPYNSLVSSVAVEALPDGTPVIISGARNGTVRVWRLADGTPVGEPLRGCDGPVEAVAMGALPDGTPVIVLVARSPEDTMRVWRLADGTPVGEPLWEWNGTVEAVAVGALPDGTPIVVSADRDGTVRVWRLADGTPVGGPLRGHTQTVRGLAVGRLPDGTPIVVSGSDDGTVRVWRLADAISAGKPLPGHTGAVRGLAGGTLPDGTPVIVSAGGIYDRTVRVWRLADGTPAGEPLREYDGIVDAVGALPDGTPIVVSGSYYTARVWRLADGTPVGRLADGTPAGEVLRRIYVTAAAIGALPDGTPVIVIVSGSGEDPVRVWRLADGTPVGEPLWEWDGIVQAVAVGALPDGTPIVVSGSDYGTVRVWRLADGNPVGAPLWKYGGDLAEGAVRAVAVGRLPDGTPIVVNGSDDGTVRVWRLADRTPVVPPLELPEPVSAVAVHGNLIVTAAGADIAVHQLTPYNPCEIVRVPQ